MALHFILDGYNIIKQTPDLADRQLEQGRESLIQLIKNERPQGSLNNKVTIVFDSRQSDAFDCSVRSAIGVIFTCGESADEKIKSLVSSAANKKNIVVVTNDREIQYYVRALGAKICKVDEFLSKALQSFQKKQRVPGSSKTYSREKISKGVESKINSELRNLWLKKSR